MIAAARQGLVAGHHAPRPRRRSESRRPWRRQRADHGRARGHVDIVTLLLDRGANIDDVVDGDENALIQASGSGA